MRQEVAVCQSAGWSRWAKPNAEPPRAAGEGESVLTIKRRLATTAELLGTVLTVKRVGDSLYFWVEPPPEPVEEELPRRRGRRRREQR